MNSRQRGGARQASLWLRLWLRLNLSGPTSLGLGTGTEPNRSEPHRICGMNSLEMIEISFHCDDEGEGEGEQEIEFNSIPRLVCRLLLLLPWSSLLLPGLLFFSLVCSSPWSSLLLPCLHSSLVFSASLCSPLLLLGLPCFFLVCSSSPFSSLLLPSPLCFSLLFSPSAWSALLLSTSPDRLLRLCSLHCCLELVLLLWPRSLGCLGTT